MLDKNKWFIYLILNILSLGLYTFYIGQKLKIYDKNQWYAYIPIWIIAILAGLIPAILMFFIFYIQIGVEVSKKLEVPYKNIYGYPYMWILLFILPIVGWSFFIVLIIYVHFWYIIYIKRGYKEKYI